jgi:hypothetical protein
VRLLDYPRLLSVALHRRLDCSSLSSSTASATVLQAVDRIASRTNGLVAAQNGREPSTKANGSREENDDVCARHEWDVAHQCLL